jgi:apoptosis-inducing factor 2
MTTLPDRPTVAVVGGGYGGIAVAKALDGDVNVVLVEPKDAFVHNVAALRALVDPSWLERIFIPYDGLLANGRVVHDRAVRVRSGHVTLRSGEEITADYIVLATGSRYPFPAKSDSDQSADAQTRYRAANQALAAASSILIVGAGPVGIELAGEIKAVWPEKTVTLLDRSEELMGGPYTPELRAELRRQLAELNVRLLLGTSFTAAPDTQAGELGPFTVQTTTGETVTGDLWYRSHGVAPVSDYLSEELAATRRPSGDLIVTPELRLQGHDHIFALGDVADADRKMAGIAGMQAEIVAHNIHALIDANDDLKSWETFPPAIAVPIGPEGGAGQLPGVDGVAGPDLIADLKGREMMIDRFAEMLGAAAEDRAVG